MAPPVENQKSERKKMIAAGALGLVALLTLWYAFFGSTPKATTTTPAPGTSSASKNLPPRRADGTTADASGPLATPRLGEEVSQIPPSPIDVNYTQPAGVPEAGRNIFAFYVPPPPVEKPTPAPPPPTPTPTPPVMVSGIKPTNVYARTGDFKLEVNGERFTPQTQVYIDGRQLETRFVGPQQLSASVPAAVLSYEGARQIMVRNSDGTIYSNTATLSVAAPPAPNFTYVGLVGGPRYDDTAILKDKGNKNLVNVQRGDTVGGRFRVTSISQREVVLVDSTLRIKHSLPLTVESGTPGARGPQQPIQPEGGDEEP